MRARCGDNASRRRNAPGCSSPRCQHRTHCRRGGTHDHHHTSALEGEDRGRVSSTAFRCHALPKQLCIPSDKTQACCRTTAGNASDDGTNNPSSWILGRQWIRPRSAEGSRAASKQTAVHARWKHLALYPRGWPGTGRGTSRSPPFRITHGNRASFERLLRSRTTAPA